MYMSSRWDSPTQIVPRCSFAFTEVTRVRWAESGQKNSCRDHPARDYFASQANASAASVPPSFNIHAQTACEAEILGNMGAHEVFSGKAYNLLAEVAGLWSANAAHLYAARRMEHGLYRRRH